MRILIIEDDDERIKHFREKLANHELTFARDNNELIKKYSPPYDVIFFDFDLGRDGLKYEDNGELAAKNIKEKGLDKNALKVIHSWNPEGAKRIQQVFPGAPYAAFGSKYFNAVIDSLKRISK